jgi:hypothetical protein
MIDMREILIAIASSALLSVTALAQEPSLPTGLEGPSLPSGLGSPAKKSEPAPESLSAPAIGLSGFFDTRIGTRVRSAQGYEEGTLREARAQVSLDWSGEAATIKLTSDFVLDGVVTDRDIDLDRGEGWVDLREASLLLRPTDFLDVKLGRQILTWGTGDLLFINDLFPKDWNAFFIGRDLEYLKAPSDAVKVSLFGDRLNADVIVTPEFDSDRYLDGRRLTYFNPLEGALSETAQALAVTPEKGSEIAIRLYGQVSSYEWAVYGYHGFWKSPVGFDALALTNTFPELKVMGASLRGPAAGGIISGEVGYYDSEESRGPNFMVPASEWRVLLGFERELRKDLTGGVQVYLEQKERGKDRQIVTLRLTQQLLNQNLTLGLFNFYSPSDEDGYLRLNAHYKFTDSWQGEIGSNVFYGESERSFFGQFERNSNVFIALRTSF